MLAKRFQSGRFPYSYKNEILALTEAESGVTIKNHGGKHRVCLAYPNTYHVGMSNLGFRIIYALINKMDDALCERTFLPEPDTYNEFKRTDTVLFSYESLTPLTSFDIIAFSVSYENDYINVLKILDLAKIPVFAKDRTETHPLVIMGGPCAFMNPEPLAPFFDIICVGEGEPLIESFFSKLKNSTCKSDFLKSLSSEDGFYIPSDTASNVKRVYVKDLNTLETPSQLITEHTEFSNMYLVEAMRGCPWKCRFCAISSIYNPPRKRQLSRVLEEIDRVKPNCLKVGLIGPSLTDYPRLEDVLNTGGVEFSITSLRASRKSAEILPLMKDKQSVSIAPEAGSERLRSVINKKITHEDIISTCQLIFENGINLLKLYFMVGLPTETNIDISEIINLVREVRALSKHGQISLSVSPFVPKAFTPFQWHPMESAHVVKERLKTLKNALKKDGIQVHHDTAGQAYVEGFFARSGKEASLVLNIMLKKKLNLKAAATEAQVDYEKRLFEKLVFDSPLPWDFIYSTTDKQTLWNEYIEALR
ncbi:radical SAM protein [Candidatus Magnetomonas plexicatena]|uniref:radical SAM protein n=1 Tax=Candidatus Magnetomonas plexicatena TaxID=2552947 RepID=UPI001C746AB2|nr:radical SAM protein [Nitrospirales bacterium LBB_01]